MHGRSAWKVLRAVHHMMSSGADGNELVELSFRPCLQMWSCVPDAKWLVAQGA